ncbi:MAG: MurR/RpiR family transcriptional regulator [Synergistes sp.]|nr:MurR/RpiR family transcriptional regulator [Synergistes sp.]
MPEKNASMFKRIAAKSGSFSPKLLKLAQYIEKNYTKLAYATMTELASLADVSETTVVRFVYTLGYKGFPEFKSALREELSLNSKRPTMNAFDIKKEDLELPGGSCRAIFAMEMQVMAETLAGINEKDFANAVDMISKAKNVFIVSCGANSCCGRALLFALQVTKPNIYLIEKLDITEHALIRSSEKNSLCIVFSTPRYPMETQKILNVIRKRGIPVIGFSDSILSPIFPYSKIFFHVPEKYVTFIDANAAYMALIHALAVSICKKDESGSRKMIAEYNEAARSTDYYVNGDVELVDAAVV